MNPVIQIIVKKEILLKYKLSTWKCDIIYFIIVIYFINLYPNLQVPIKWYFLLFILHILMVI